MQIEEEGSVYMQSPESDDECGEDNIGPKTGADAMSMRANIDICYDWGLCLSRSSTYWLWLWYKVCHVLLVTDYSISQRQVSHVH